MSTKRQGAADVAVGQQSNLRRHDAYIALISWTPAADNVGVTRYRIMNGTTVLTEVDGNTRTRGSKI
ncbi:hypothetical protein [Paenibacillus xanthanilyticus]|uniref:Uncharacterized protein n=1 Tax=Paenibacillus xanthanilyticus TaxID=1783531 RepID=A0ABV8K132_9BACL